MCNAPLACTNMCSSNMGHTYKIGHQPKLIISQEIMGTTTCQRNNFFILQLNEQKFI